MSSANCTSESSKATVYQHGTRIAGERDSRPNHVTAWTWNVAEELCMRLCSSMCVHLRACICTQKIKRLDASLFNDFRDVLYVHVCTCGNIVVWEGVKAL